MKRETTIENDKTTASDGSGQSQSHSELTEPMLPTSTEKTAWRSIYIAGLCSFIQATQFAIFFASMWPYILTLDPHVKQSSFGIVVALYSFSQCICSPVFGYWSNKIGQVRFPLIIGFIIMAFGNLTYLSLQFWSDNHLYVMMGARLVAGAGTGNMGLLRAYASTASTSKDRSRAIACVSGGIAIGSMVGPGLQLLFAPLGTHGITIFGLTINIYTSPALFCLLLNALGLLIVNFAFEEKYIIKSDKTVEVGKEEGEKQGTNTKLSKLANPDVIALLLCVFTRFSQIFLNTTTESIGSAYTMMMFSFEKEEAVTVNAGIHTVSGSIAAAMYICFIFTGTYFIGFVLVFGVSFSFMNITVTTLYSKIVGPRPQGTYQGVYQMAGSFGRLIAPLLMSSTYTMFGPTVPWQILIVTMIIIIAAWLVLRERMVPFEKHVAKRVEPVQ
uniref:Major facilitator superfamily (MFS) profile domain-containing protein n=1 Tax=Caenorhabditis japonica TaxID=281687 RepID=A0A8R1I0T5_CAEJA